MKKLPYIKSNGKHSLLYVDDKPFTMLSGEIHNSSSSSARYMDEVVWPSLRKLNMNSVILPVYWENIEPEEDKFDFTLVDELITQARRENVKIAFLWFGLWKNGRSTYVPGWVKNNPDKYFYVQDASGRKLQTISPLCKEGVEADAKAFAKLMSHLREFDSNDSTVIMMQVENEIGVLGAPRDFSPVAEKAFNELIPANMASHFGVDGTWEQAFGDDSCEYFMAYHYSCAVEHIAASGKAEYQIPMLVNAWIEQFPSIPGSYPSGGPIAKVAHIWKLNAPSIDVYAPDIYVEHFRDVCDEYAAIPGNPLCIPETRGSLDSVPFLLYALGKHNAICFAPFAIEDLFLGNAEGLSESVLEALNISATAFKRDPVVGENLAYAYKQIKEMLPVILKAHEEGRIHAFLEHHDNGEVIKLKDRVIKVTYNRGVGTFFRPATAKGDAPVAGGFIIELGDGEYLIAGVECRVEILPKIGSKQNVGVLHKEEGVFKDGKWIPGRTLNGDEGYFHVCGSKLTMLKISTFEY